MAGAVVAGAGMNGIFSALGSVVTEVGDTLQALIAALQATTVIDRDVEHREVIYVQSGKNKGRVKEVKVTTDHWRVNLLEVVMAGLILGLWEISTTTDGKVGLNLKAAAAPAFGAAGVAGAAVDPESPFWWATPWGTAIELWKQWKAYK